MTTTPGEQISCYRKIAEYRSYVPKTVLIPEEEFQSLYASYIQDCQIRRMNPLDAGSFLFCTGVNIL